MYKICYVVTISGSIRAFFVPQLQYLAKNGLDVTVICAPDNALQQLLGNDIRYIPVDIPRGVSLKGSFFAIRELARIFKKEKFDLIQYSTPNAAFYASLSAKKAGCKLRNYHMMGIRYLGASGNGRMVLKWLEKVTCKNSTHIECVSKSNRDLGIKEGLFPSDKVTVVWNGSTGGVDLERFNYSRREEWRKEVREELGYNENEFVYGFVGRITRDKGINELIESFSLLNNDTKLFIIGPQDEMGTLNQELLEQARKNKNILFHDGVYDIERYYAAIDALILPSYREGFGNVIIEAGAVGTPAIVSNIPGPI